MVGQNRIDLTNTKLFILSAVWYSHLRLQTKQTDKLRNKSNEV